MLTWKEVGTHLSPRGRKGLVGTESTAKLLHSKLPRLDLASSSFCSWVNWASSCSQNSRLPFFNRENWSAWTAISWQLEMNVEETNNFLTTIGNEERMQIIIYSNWVHEGSLKHVYLNVHVSTSIKLWIEQPLLTIMHLRVRPTTPPSTGSSNRAAIASRSSTCSLKPNSNLDICIHISYVNNDEAYYFITRFIINS